MTKMRDHLRVFAAEKVSPARVEGPELDRYRGDWQLVRDCMSGDRGRWLELLETHEATIHHAIINTFRLRGLRVSQDRVSDIQADIFLRLVKDDFRKLSRYSGRCKLSHWLKVVTGNYVIDVLRQRRPSVSLDDTDSSSSRAIRTSLLSRGPSPERALTLRRQREAFWEMCEELSESDRRFIELHIRRELSFDEIAQEMQTTVGAVYARKNRVRKKLREFALERGHDLV